MIMYTLKYFVSITFLSICLYMIAFLMCANVCLNAHISSMIMNDTICNKWPVIIHLLLMRVIAIYNIAYIYTI